MTEAPKKPKAREFAMACMVADALRRLAVPGLFWTALPLDGNRPKKLNPKTGKFYSPAGQRMERIGTRKGSPDYLLIHAGKVYGLELKLETNALFGTKKTYQSPEQKETQRDWEAAGGTYGCTHGLNETLAQLEAWGLIIGRMQ